MRPHPAAAANPRRGARARDRKSWPGCESRRPAPTSFGPGGRAAERPDRDAALRAELRIDRGAHSALGTEANLARRRRRRLLLRRGLYRARVFGAQDEGRYRVDAAGRRGSAQRIRQRRNARLLRVCGLFALHPDILDRGHRGQRSILERFVHRLIVRVGQLAHLAIELKFAEALYRERAFMLVALDLKLTGRLGARSDQPDSERSGDEQRDSGDNQRGGKNEHRLPALLELFFESAPEFGIEWHLLRATR